MRSKLVMPFAFRSLYQKVVRAAVSQRGRALRHASVAFRESPEIALLAVASNGLALFDAAVYTGVHLTRLRITFLFYSDFMTAISLVGIGKLGHRLLSLFSSGSLPVQPRHCSSSCKAEWISPCLRRSEPSW